MNPGSIFSDFAKMCAPPPGHVHIIKVYMSHVQRIQLLAKIAKTYGFEINIPNYAIYKNVNYLFGEHFDLPFLLHRQNNQINQF